VPDLHLRVSDEAIAATRNSLRKINGPSDKEFDIGLVEISREAIGLYRWVLERMADGYAICTTDVDGTLIQQIDTPSTQRTDYVLSVDRDVGSSETKDSVTED
jgi:hypothetical protein